MCNARCIMKPTDTNSIYRINMAEIATGQTCEKQFENLDEMIFFLLGGKASIPETCIERLWLPTRLPHVFCVSVYTENGIVDYIVRSVTKDGNPIYKAMRHWAKEMGDIFRYVLEMKKDMERYGVKTAQLLHETDKIFRHIDPEEYAEGKRILSGLMSSLDNEDAINAVAGALNLMDEVQGVAERRYGMEFPGPDDGAEEECECSDTEYADEEEVQEDHSAPTGSCDADDAAGSGMEEDADTADTAADTTSGE